MKIERSTSVTIRIHADELTLGALGRIYEILAASGRWGEPVNVTRDEDTYVFTIDENTAEGSEEPK